jgi:plastocyanin
MTLPLRLAPMAAAALAAVVAPASAQPAPDRVAVALNSFAFSPATISLVHGHPYVLELANTASGGHDFSAPAFFAAAQIAPGDRARIGKRGIEVPSGQTVTIALTAPKPGHYRLRCTHFLHSTMGMTGEIVVT